MLITLNSLLSAVVLLGVLSLGNLSATESSLDKLRKADELLLIDAGVAEAGTLARIVRSGIDVVPLRAGADAQEQVIAALRSRSALKAIHFVSHGAPGSLELGNQWLDAKSLQSPERQPLLKSLRTALAEKQGELLLYGCDVAAGEKGKQWINLLSQGLGITVRASNNKTGSVDLGGDWRLENSTGEARTALAFNEASDYRHLLPKPVVETYQSTLWVRPGEPSYTWTIGVYNNGQGGSAQPTTVAYGNVAEFSWFLNRGTFQYSTNGGSSWNNMTVNSNSNLVYYPIVGSIFRFLDQSPADFASDQVGLYMQAPAPIYSIGGSGTLIQPDRTPTNITSSSSSILDNKVSGYTVATLTPEDTGMVLGGHWAIDSQSVPNLFTIHFDNTVGNTATLKIGSGTMPAGGQTATVTVRYYDPYDTDSAGAPIPADGFSKQLSFDIIASASRDLDFNHEAVVNTYLPFGQEYPAIATLSNGNYVIVWQSAGEGKPAGYAGVYARIYSPLGVAQGLPFVISNASSSSDERMPSVIALANGRFAVVYQALNTSDPLTYHVGLRIVEANGTVGSQIRVNTAVRNFYAPGIGALNDGSLLVAYADADTGDLFVQQISAADGSKIGSETEIAEDAYLAGVCALDNGGYAVSWVGYLDGIARFKTNTGSVTDTGMVTGYGVAPRMLPLTGGFLFVTDDYDDVTSLSSITAQRYNNAGVAQGSAVNIPADTSVNCYAPSVAKLSGGGFVFSWQSSKDLYSNGVFGRRFDQSLVAVDTNDFQINEYREGDQSMGVVTALADNAFAASWMDYLTTNDIETRVLQPEGSSPIVTPTLTATPTSASVTHNSATLGGNVTVTGGADVTARGVVYALTSANANPEIGGASVTVLTETGTFSTGAFTRSASSLTASSGYSFKAYATNSAGTSYSSVGNFTTNAAPAVAPTLAATPTSNSVTYEAATLGGNVTATGGADVTVRGVVYALTSANANPEIGGASVTVVPETGTFSTGTFTRSATSLTASSGYSFKAYATNSAGTSYSSVGTFTTSAAPPPAVVIQPTAILGHSLLRSSEYTAEASINQVGLTATYTSGVTTLTSYATQNPRQGFTTALSEGFTATADGQVNAIFDYDLGALYDLEKVLFWNTKNDEASRVVTFQVFVDTSPGFGSAVNLGTFTPSSGSSSFPTPLEVFNLPAATSRYVRFRVLTNGGAAYSELGEIAFAGRTSTSIPAVGVASLARNSAVYTQAGPAIWTLYFQSPVTGVTASNFDLTGDGATGATVGTPTTNDGGNSWTIPVSVGGEGQLMLRLANTTGLSAPISNPLPFNGQSYYVDTVPPMVTIQSGPSLLTNSTSASFAFSATDAGSGVEHYEAKLDNGSYEVVTSPKSYTGLPEGEHTVVIKAVDNATNEGAASYTWTVDLTPPVVQSVTRLTPAGQNVNVAEVVFRVTYSEPVTLNAPQTARYAVVPVNGSTITADVTSVSGSGATRDVTVTITGGDGEFRLRVLN